MTRPTLTQPIRPPADKRREAAPRPVPCLCGSLAYENVGDGLPRTDCCHAY